MTSHKKGEIFTAFMTYKGVGKQDQFPDCCKDGFWHHVFVITVVLKYYIIQSSNIKMVTKLKKTLKNSASILSKVVTMHQLHAILINLTW